MLTKNIKNCHSKPCGWSVFVYRRETLLATMNKSPKFKKLWMPQPQSTPPLPCACESLHALLICEIANSL